MIFQWRQDLIWINITLEYDRKRYQINDCIVDTGSATTAFDIDLIKFNYNRPTQLKRLSGVGGATQEVVSQIVDKITLDQIELNSIRVEFGDLKNNYGINGFVGTDILSRFQVYIDFPGQEIHLKEHVNMKLTDTNIPKQD